MRSTLIEVIIATMAALALPACQMSARLALTPDSTPEHMTFVLTAWFDSTPGYLQEVTVSRCVDRGCAFTESGEVMWSAFLTTGAEAPLVGRFGYGQNLSGLTTSHEPAPLGPGCYIVRAYARFPDTRQAVLVVRVRLRQTSPATTIRPWSEASAAAQDDSPCAVGCVPR